MAKKSETEAPAKITPQDIENKLRALQGDVQGKVDEKKTTIASAAAAGGVVLLVIFFLLGTAVAWVTLPYAVDFLLGFQIEGSLTALPSAEAYFSFVTIMFLLFGLVMQFPIVLIFLDRLGVLRVEQLQTMRRYVLLGVVIFAVVITPGGDPISPIVLAGTMYALYEFTIFVMQRRRRERGSDA